MLVQIGEYAFVLVEYIEMLAADGAEGLSALAPLPVEHADAVEQRDAFRRDQGGVRPGNVLVGPGREAETVRLDEIATVGLVPDDLRQIEQCGPLRQGEHRGLGAAEEVRPPVGQQPAVPEAARVVVDQDVGVVGRVEASGDAAQRSGRQGVVTVEEEQVVAGRQFDPGITGVAQPHVLGQVEYAHPGVALRVLVEDGAGAVRRAVVHGDDLEVGEVLLQHGVEALPDIPLHVVRRHDECQSRHPSPVQRAVCRVRAQAPIRSAESWGRA